MLILKQLRRKKKINQTDLAKIIGVSLRTIQLYEMKDANIPIKNLTKIANYFRVSIAELYTHEVNDNEGLYVVGGLSINGDNNISLGHNRNILRTPLLFNEKYKEYLDNYFDETYLNGLTHLNFLLEEVEKGKYIAFEILGDAMDNGKANAIPNKSIVLGREMNDEDFLMLAKQKDEILAVIICENRILCKKILAYNQQENSIRCSNLNELPEYTDFELSMNDVHTIFKIVKKQV